MEEEPETPVERYEDSFRNRQRQLWEETKTATERKETDEKRVKKYLGGERDSFTKRHRQL